MGIIRLQTRLNRERERERERERVCLATGYTLSYDRQIIRFNYRTRLILRLSLNE